MYVEQRSINYFLPSRPAWFTNKKMSGGGIVMNYGAHAFDRLFYTTGARPVSVNASCRNFINDRDVEGHAQIFAKLDNGASATVTLNGYCAVGYDTYFYFTKGALRTSKTTLEINRGDGQGFVPYETPAAALPSFAQEIDAFHRYIKGEPTDIPTGEYSRQIIDAIQTAYEKSL
jgi:predicted dehydrogenase